MWRFFLIPALVLYFFVSPVFVVGEFVSKEEFILLKRERVLMQAIRDLKRLIKGGSIDNLEEEGGRIGRLLELTVELRNREEELRLLRDNNFYRKMRARLGWYSIKKESVGAYIKQLNQLADTAELAGRTSEAAYYRKQIDFINAEVARISALGPVNSGLERERVTGGELGVKRFTKQRYSAEVWPQEGVFLKLELTPASDDFNRTATIQFRVVVSDPLSERNLTPANKNVFAKRELEKLRKASGARMKAAEDFERLSRASEILKTRPGTPLLRYLPEASPVMRLKP